jgi:hypothetical protein
MESLRVFQMLDVFFLRRNLILNAWQIVQDSVLDSSAFYITLLTTHPSQSD